jgi:hypothetical protein
MNVVLHFVDFVVLSMCSTQLLSPTTLSNTYWISCSIILFRNLCCSFISDVLFEPTRVWSVLVHNDIVAGSELYDPFPFPLCRYLTYLGLTLLKISIKCFLIMYSLKVSPCNVIRSSILSSSTTLECFQFCGCGSMHRECALVSFKTDLGESDLWSTVHKSRHLFCHVHLLFSICREI